MLLCCSIKLGHPLGISEHDSLRKCVGLRRGYLSALLSCLSSLHFDGIALHATILRLTMLLNLETGARIEPDRRFVLSHRPEIGLAGDLPYR